MSSISSFRVADAMRPRVAWAIRYAARRRLAAPVRGSLDGLTRAQAERLLRALDAACDTAPASVLPFTDFAVLDELGADLADWLRLPEQSPAA
ncbi:MAG: hypothetical protein QOD55_1428 [Solirubrobacteraceae bacterium]|jgi:hypothetical protein|nr:hypothetical protein [Solirubrobacteraceae bacterium]